jgi:hypothetical protein
LKRYPAAVGFLTYREEFSGKPVRQPQQFFKNMTIIIIQIFSIFIAWKSKKFSKS